MRGHLTGFISVLLYTPSGVQQQLLTYLRFRGSPQTIAEERFRGKATKVMGSVVFKSPDMISISQSFGSGKIFWVIGVCAQRTHTSEGSSEEILILNHDIFQLQAYDIDEARAEALSCAGFYWRPEDGWHLTVGQIDIHYPDTLLEIANAWSN